MGLPWVATPKSAPETWDVAQKSAAGAGDAAQQHHLQSEGKVNSTAAESTDSTTVQAPAKPQGQPHYQQSPLCKGEIIKPNQVCLANNDEVLWWYNPACPLPPFQAAE